MGAPKAEEYLEQLEPETALRVLEAALVVIFLTLLPMGLYVLQIGRRVIKTELFPPPGVKVIADTQLVQGRKARNYGRMFVILGLVLISLGLFGALYTQYMLRKLREEKRSATTTARISAEWREANFVVPLIGQKSCALQSQ